MNYRPIQPLTTQPNISIGVGGGAAASTAELRDFANQMNNFGAALSAFGERRKLAEEDELLRLQSIEELTGQQLADLGKQLGKKVRDGELHEGANPVNQIGRGVLAVQNSINIQAKTELLARRNEFLTKDATPEQAKAFTQEVLSKYARSDMNIMEQRAFVQAAGNLQQEFLSNIINGQYEARAQATRDEAMIAIDQTLGAYGIGMGEEDRVTFVNNQKAQLDVLRNIGIKDANAFYVQNIVLPRVEELAEEDPVLARRMLSDIRNMDVTGNGGLLGNIGPIKSAFEKAEDYLLKKEFEDPGVLQLQKKQQEDKVHGRRMLEGIAATDSTDPKLVTDNARLWFEENYKDDPMIGLRRVQFEEQLEKFTRPKNQQVEEDIYNIVTKRLIIGDNPEEVVDYITTAVNNGELSGNRALNMLNIAGSFGKIREPINELVENTVFGNSRELSTGIASMVQGVSPTVAPKLQEVLQPELTSLMTTQSDELRQAINKNIQADLRASGINPQTYFSDPERVQSVIDRAKKELTPVFQKQNEELKLKTQRKAEEFALEDLRSQGEPSGVLAWFSNKSKAYYDLPKGVNVEQSIVELRKAEDEAMKISKRQLPIWSSKEAEAEAKATVIKEKVMDIRKVLGFTPREILQGRTEKGVQFDPATDVNPYVTPLFESLDQLKATPDKTIDKLSEIFIIDRDELLVQQGALLRKRNPQPIDIQREVSPPSFDNVSQ